MSDLVEFLSARQDEREQTARAAAEPERWVELNREPRPTWHVQYWADPDRAAVVADPESSAYPVVATTEGMDEADAEARVTHIAHHDPDRVLRRVAADRRIMAEHACYPGFVATLGYEPNGSMCRADGQSYPCLTLRLLALPDDDHPDYDPGWKP